VTLELDGAEQPLVQFNSLQVVVVVVLDGVGEAVEFEM